MIPKVRTWKIHVVESGEVLYVEAPTKLLSQISARLDYPRVWGKTLKISPVRKPVRNLNTQQAMKYFAGE